MIGTYDPIIAEASRRFGVPEDRIRAVMGVESGGQQWARSPKGASGLMQVMPDTYAELSKRHGFGPDRFDPRNNIFAGTAYLGEMYSQFGNWDEATQAYNMGPGRAMKVRNGTATVPAETVAYLPKVNAALGIGNQTQGGDVAPGLINPRPGQTTGMGPMFGAARPGQSLTGLLEIEDENNFQDGIGNLLNMGQTESQPPRTDPAALPGSTQTSRLDLSGRINEMIKSLSDPGGRPQMPSQLQYMLAGAQKGVQGLTGVHDRPVGIGEMLGALGGGVTSGDLAGNEAQFKDRANQFRELGGLTEMQKYQRGEATSSAKVEAAMRYAAQLRATGNADKVAMADAIEKDPSLIDNVIGRQAEYAFPKPVRGVGQMQPPTPVTLGDGPQGPGVYARNPDGTTGPRLGASETGPGTETTETVTQEQAQADGLPPPPANSPYSNPNLSPRGRSNLVAAEQKRWEKRSADTSETVKTATTLITDMERFKFLNDKVNNGGLDTGGFGGNPLVAGIRGMWNEDLKEMQSITARITPTLRQPGSGATSDFDARMFQEGTVGVGKEKATNDNIATATIEGGKNLIARAQFEQQYFEAYRHTAGMDAAWQKYLNDNPIFDPKAPPGSYELNKNRVEWQTYFRNGGKLPEKAPPTSGANIPAPPPGAVLVP